MLQSILADEWRHSSAKIEFSHTTLVLAGWLEGPLASPPDEYSESGGGLPLPVPVSGELLELLLPLEGGEDPPELELPDPLLDEPEELELPLEEEPPLEPELSPGGHIGVPVAGS